MVGPPDSLHVRMIRSALGDPQLYDDLARDPGAIRQSLFVVIFVAVLHGLAATLTLLYVDVDRTSASQFLYWSIFTAGGWLLSALFAYMIVSIIAGTSAAGFLGGTFMQFLRSAGFSASPGMLLILTPIPVIGQAALIASIFWIATAMMIAVRESLSCSTALAAVAVIIGTITGRILIGLTLVITFGSAAQG